MEVETLSPISVQAEVKKYTLVGDDIYVKRYTNDTVPDWYRSLLADIIASDLTIADINTAIGVLESLPAGFNQSITNLRNENETINASLTSLATKDSEKTAAISQLDLTKIDSQSAQAIALEVVGSYFVDGSAAAWFSNKISTYASQIAANASSISTLVSSVEDSIARIDVDMETRVTEHTALASMVTSVDAKIDTVEAQIIQSYTVYVDENISYDVKVYSSNGSLFRNGIINTTLTTKVQKGNDDVTADIPPAKFSWVRVSNDVDGDTQWNIAHSGIGNSVVITTSDVYGRAVFRCVVNLI